MIRTLRLGTLALLVAGVALAAATGAARADKDDDKKKEEEARKLAKIKAAAADLDKVIDGKMMPAAVAKAHDIEPIMYTMKPSGKGGVGQGDGFEVKIRAIAASKKAWPEAKLKAEADELTRLTKYTKAIGEVSDYLPIPKQRAKNATDKDWKRYNEEMRKASDDLADAVKKMDPEAVKTAGTKLNSSCVSCHTKFRDFMEP